MSNPSTRIPSKLPQKRQSSLAASILAVIPVRMESTRLPNKPLALINGKPLVLWVYEHALQCKALSRVVIATDSDAIQKCAIEAGAEVVMTSSAPRNGTERVAEAVEALDRDSKKKISWDVVFNVQGDMPFIQPVVIEHVATEFFAKRQEFEMATLALPITDEQEYRNNNTVKAVFGQNGRALYFSRSSIPHYRDGLDLKDTSSQDPIAYKHIGLYAYRPDTLRKLVQFNPTPLEKAENLEQLRAIEHGLSLLVVPVQRNCAGPSIEVDTNTDLEKANEVAKTYLMP